MQIFWNSCSVPRVVLMFSPWAASSESAALCPWHVAASRLWIISLLYRLEYVLRKLLNFLHMFSSRVIPSSSLLCTRGAEGIVTVLKLFVYLLTRGILFFSKTPSSGTTMSASRSIFPFRCAVSKYRWGQILLDRKAFKNQSYIVLRKKGSQNEKNCNWEIQRRRSAGEPVRSLGK